MKTKVAPLLALRYLTGKKSHSAVNTIAIVAICGVAIATAALICVLSVFNGFRDVLTERLDRLSPDLIVIPKEGKTFSASDSLTSSINRFKNVKIAMESLEDQALVIVNSQELPVRVLGINPVDYRKLTAIDSLLLDGSKPLSATAADESANSPVLLSIGVASRTNLFRADEKLLIFAPKRIGRFNPANPAAGFITDSLTVSGVFQSDQAAFDNDVIITEIETVRNLLMRDNDEASAIMIALQPESDIPAAKQQISRFVGNDFKVLDRAEQQSDNFRMIQIEKWMTYLLLFFIVIVASFNIISALCVLVIEKEGAMRTMRALGMSRSRIGKIFAWESIYVTLAGGISGILLGTLLVILQERFGFIKLNAPSDTLIITAYPVRLIISDIFVSLLPIILTGLATAGISYKFAKSRS